MRGGVPGHAAALAEGMELLAAWAYSPPGHASPSPLTSSSLSLQSLLNGGPPCTSALQRCAAPSSQQGAWQKERRRLLGSPWGQGGTGREVRQNSLYQPPTK